MKSFRFFHVFAANDPPAQPSAGATLDLADIMPLPPIAIKGSGINHHRTRTQKSSPHRPITSLICLMEPEVLMPNIFIFANLAMVSGAILTPVLPGIL